MRLTGTPSWQANDTQTCFGSAAHQHSDAEWRAWLAGRYGIGMSFVKDYATDARMADITFISAYGGINNDNLDQVAARLHKSGLWDNLTTVIFSPVTKAVPTLSVVSWGSLQHPPNTQVARLYSIDHEVGYAYSEVIDEVILKNEQLSKWKFLLTIEHDNLPPPDGMIRLLARMQENPHLSAISGLYFNKAENGFAHIWGKPGENHFCPQPPATDGSLVECHAVSMGFTLFRIEMFKDERLPRPLFETKATATRVRTHDLDFWANASELGYRCAVDCGCRVGHVDLETMTVW